MYKINVFCNRWLDIKLVFDIEVWLLMIKIGIMMVINKICDFMI